MKQLIMSLFLISLTFQILAQSSNKIHIKGQINDRETSKWLSAATITCLLAKDSSRVALEFTDKNGIFSFDSLPAGKYYLYITFMGYKPLIYPVDTTLNSGMVDLETISLDRVRLTLAEVEIVELKKPLRITKDTLEYNAGYFKTKNNALVEDLLKKIPGIQIDNEGVISINGEIIKAIMVNGRSIFDGSDPKNLTRNLQADLIDKVQLIDRPTYKGEGEGIGGSRSDKIINITIKKEKNNLISGEITNAYGTSNRFYTKANISRFTPHQQLLIFGAGDNLNGAIDSKSQGNGGAQRSWNSGVSFSDQLYKKLTINTSFLLTNNTNENLDNSTRQYITSDSSFFDAQQSRSILKAQNYSGSVQLEYKIDSLQTITLWNQLTVSTSSSLLQSSNETTGDKSLKINTGHLNNSENKDGGGIFSSLRYQKMFPKKGRQLDVTLSVTKSSGKTVGYNISTNEYYPQNGEIISDSINQNTIGKTGLQQIFIMATYVEPISKYGVMTFSLGEDHLKGNVDRSVYDYSKEKGSYDNINDSLSSQFDNNPNQHYVKIGWRYGRDKFDYSLSSATLFYEINAMDRNPNITISKRIAAFLPDANFSILIKNNKRLRFSYGKTTEFPSALQLRPLPDKSNPLNVTKGNPDLEPMGTNNFNFIYNSFDNITLKTFSIIANIKLTTNQIVNASWYDSIGRQTTQPINRGKGYTYNLKIENSFPINKIPNSLSLTTSASFKKTPSYINDIHGYSNSFSLSQSVRYHYEYQRILEFSISSIANYSNVHYSSLGNSMYSFFGGAFNISNEINLPFGTSLSSDLYLIWSTGKMTGYNATPILLNALISKSLFMHKRGMIQLQVFDLLNQNKNITRVVTPIFIEDTKRNTLGRFSILKFSYFLGKNGN